MRSQDMCARVNPREVVNLGGLYSHARSLRVNRVLLLTEIACDQAAQYVGWVYSINSTSIGGKQTPSNAELDGLRPSYIGFRLPGAKVSSRAQAQSGI
jgi:hypothetical protein